MTHQPVSYARSRYAREFLDACQEHTFARQLIGLANRKVDNEWTIQRALKNMAAARRHRKLAKEKLDRVRLAAKRGGV